MISATRVARGFTLALFGLSLVAQPVAAGEWIELLEGDSLAEQWRGYQSDDVPAAWRLADGVLSLDGTGGDLRTREEFSDFELEFEFKIAPGGNSGVIYLVSEDGKHAHQTGPEFQVLDPQFPGVTELTGPGALYGLYPAPPAVSNAAGEWNTGRIVVRDGAVEHWLNGQCVVEASIGSDEWNDLVNGSKFAAWSGFGKNEGGAIVLQDHGSQVWYRGLRVRRLAKPIAVSSKPSRLLFVTQSAGFRHSAVTRKASDLSHSEQVLTRLGVESGAFRVDCTQDVATEFTPESLANYDVVAFYTTGVLPIPEETREWFLNTWLAEEGHGFLGIHAAADTYKDYEPYWDMIGGSFDGHPWNSRTEVVLQLHADDHPAAAPWGEAGDRITLTEEIYNFKNWQPEKVRVLMSLDMERTEKKRPKHIPVLWVKDYGAGRVMHMSPGHNEAVWDRPDFQASLVGGIRWLQGALPGDATPNPELSAELDAVGKKAAAAAKPAKTASR